MKELVEDLKIANDNLYCANKMLEKEMERLKTELQDTKEHLGEYLHEQEEENNRLNKEVEKYKKRCYEALTLIRKNYGLLDKYGIDMLDDILNGK